MKKISFSRLKSPALILAFSLLNVSILFSQGKQSASTENSNRNFYPADAEIAPSVLARNNSFLPFLPAYMWEVKFDYNASVNASGMGGMAGICFTGTEFWVSKWNTDSILIFSPLGVYNGAFSFPPAYNASTKGIRSLTFDGMNVIASNNTSTLYKINPISRAAAGTITAPAMSPGTNTGVRHCTFDPTANAGSGGFWVGNWATDIKLISTAGALISSIPEATHNLDGMYGSAWDGLTPGGPYLWIFDQNSGFSNTHIRQVKISTGAVTNIFHDVMTDVAPNVSGLAGGLAFVPGTPLSLNANVLVGIVQGSTLSGTNANHMFGYSIKYASTIDLNMQIGVPGFGISKIPGTHVAPMTMIGRIFNYGLSTITTATMNVNVKQGGSSVFTDTQTSSSLLTLDSDDLYSAPFTPSSTPGTTYNVNLICGTGSQVDSFPANDTLIRNFTVTDSTFAHDDGNFTTTGYRSGAEGYVITTFPAEINDSVSSVWVSFFDENAGENIHAAIFNVDGNGVPVFPPIAVSPNITLSNLGDYTFVFPGGVSIPGGADFGVGVYEAPPPSGSTTTPTSIKQSYNNVIGGMNFVYVTSSGSTNPSGISSARAIRVNVGTPTMVGNVQSLTMGSSLTVFPNPGNGIFTIDFKLDQSRKFDVSITNAVGQVVKSVQGIESGHYHESFNLSSYPAGVYYIQFNGEDFNETRKLMLVH